MSESNRDHFWNFRKVTIKMVTQGTNFQFLFVDYSTANEALQVWYLAFKLLFWQNRDQIVKKRDQTGTKNSLKCFTALITETFALCPLWSFKPRIVLSVLKIGHSSYDHLFLVPVLPNFLSFDHLGLQLYAMHEINNCLLSS